MNQIDPKTSFKFVIIMLVAIAFSGAVIAPVFVGFDMTMIAAGAVLLFAVFMAGVVFPSALPLIYLVVFRKAVDHLNQPTPQGATTHNYRSQQERFPWE